MILAFIILIAVANSGLIYANEFKDDVNLFTGNTEDSIKNPPLIENISNTNNTNNTSNQNNLKNSRNNLNDNPTNPNSNSINTNDQTYSNESMNITNDSITKNNNKNDEVKKEETQVTEFAGAKPYKFTLADILTASSELKNYVEKYNKLPDYLTLANQKLSMGDFLYLLSKSIVNMNGGISSDIVSKDVKDPSSPNGAITNGNLYKSSYIDLAKRVAVYIENNAQAPNYGSSARGNMQFQTMIYGFAKIADYYKVNKVMPNYVSFTTKMSSSLNKVIPKYSGNNGLIVSGSSGSGDSDTGDDTGNTDPTPTPNSISLANIKDAGARIEAFVNTNGILPKYVEIGGKQYSMTDFLYLASTAIVNINKGISSNIAFKTFKDPSTPTGSSINGDLSKADFVDLASRVSTYMVKNGQAPNYGSSTIGNIQFESLVLGFSKILEFAKSNNRLPNYLTLNIRSNDPVNGGTSGGTTPDGDGDSSGNIPYSPMNDKYTGESLTNYLKASTNCQVSDGTIKSLATSLTKNCKTELEKATAIFNYVRDSISYSFYYNPKYGAKGTLNAKTGNCVDKSHLLIALMRTSGIAARYVNGEATFTSGSRYGHVWAQVK